MTPALVGCFAPSVCVRSSAPSCSAISDRSRSSAASRPLSAEICRRMLLALVIVSTRLAEAACRRASVSVQCADFNGLRARARDNRNNPMAGTLGAVGRRWPVIDAHE